jgi:transposase
MTKRAVQCTYGVDVAKDWLDIYTTESEQSQRIDNTDAAIEAWLRRQPGNGRLAVEATNTYHEAFIAAAHGHGHEVFVVDALKLCRYRDAVGHRAKTDRQDAALLARFLQQEHRHLEPWQPPDPRQVKLWRLLQRRATLVQATTRLRQSFADLGALSAEGADLIHHCDQLRRSMERELERQARALGWQRALKRARGIPGVGPLTALGLVAAFHRGQFRNADSFVAFLGLDVRVRDSGRFRGRRKLTKKGEPELRRLLYNAAMCACRDDHWHTYYRSLRDRGFSGTAALVALSRKLVRVSFAILTNETDFLRQKPTQACNAT